MPIAANARGGSLQRLAAAARCSGSVRRLGAAAAGGILWPGRASRHGHCARLLRWRNMFLRCIQTVVTTLKI
jgi:hypothetical protein